MFEPANTLQLSRADDRRSKDTGHAQRYRAPRLRLSSGFLADGCRMPRKRICIQAGGPPQWEQNGNLPRQLAPSACCTLAQGVRSAAVAGPFVCRAGFCSWQAAGGFNIVATPKYPFGSVSAGRALSNAGQLGASAIAVIPFLWQSSPSAANLVARSDVDRCRSARQCAQHGRAATTEAR